MRTDRAHSPAQGDSEGTGAAQTAMEQLVAVRDALSFVAKLLGLPFEKQTLMEVVAGLSADDGTSWVPHEEHLERATTIQMWKSLHLHHHRLVCHPTVVVKTVSRNV